MSEGGEQAIQVIDLGPEPGRLTWFTLEQICQLLRQHHRVEIRCGFDPYISDLVVSAHPRQKPIGATIDKLITNRIHLHEGFKVPQKAMETNVETPQKERSALIAEIDS